MTVPKLSKNSADGVQEGKASDVNPLLFQKVTEKLNYSCVLVLVNRNNPISLSRTIHYHQQPIVYRYFQNLLSTNDKQAKRSNTSISSIPCWGKIKKHSNWIYHNCVNVYLTSSPITPQYKCNGTLCAMQYALYMVVVAWQSVALIIVVEYINYIKNAKIFQFKNDKINAFCSVCVI